MNQPEKPVDAFDLIDGIQYILAYADRQRIKIESIGVDENQYWLLARVASNAAVRVSYSDIYIRSAYGDCLITSGPH